MIHLRKTKTMKQISYFTLLLLVAITAFIFSCNQHEKNEITESNTATSEPAQQEPKKIIDRSLLVGNWERTDAPYQIKISGLSDDGKMKAGYFNPKSINVANALWVFADGVFKIYVELRDENYPGSNYNLIYIPESDLLAGKYFQAVEGVTYDVGFLRKK